MLCPQKSICLAKIISDERDRPDVRSSDEFAWPVRVYHEDTDDLGIVYHAGYLRFMERSRTEWLRGLGFEQDTLRHEQDLVFAVSRVFIEYLKPARFNDLLVVGVKMSCFRRASFILEQSIWRDPDELLCRAEVKIACLHTEGFRPRPLPDFIATELKLER